MEYMKAAATALHQPNDYRGGVLTDRGLPAGQGGAR